MKARRIFGAPRVTISPSSFRVIAQVIKLTVDDVELVSPLSSFPISIRRVHVAAVLVFVFPECS
jgi:hypothetical protein